MSKIPKSVFGRTSRLLLSGAKIASKELAGRLAASLSETPSASMLATKVKQTQDLVATLGQLKGAAMKAGQLLSLEFSDLLPPEVLDVLRQLHDSSTFMPFDQVRAILARELGAERLAQLSHLSAVPIAAASIGQVHKAELNGRAVAVKIQFPGVADTIDSDLAVLRRAVSGYLALAGRKLQLDTLFQELARVLRQETDYLQEAAHAEAYRRLLSDTSYVVPEIYRDMSTGRVLTMSFERGVRLADWLAAGPGPKATDYFARLIIELLIAEFFVGGLVQTDPNYGNFLYRPVDQRLVLLDFGATNPYDAAFRRQIRELVGAIAAADFPAVLELTIRFGYLDARESQATRDLYLDMIRPIAAVFDPTHQPFAFADSAFLADLRASTMRFVQSVEHSSPAKQVIFLNRKLGGMFHLLKDAGAQLDMAAYLRQVMALSW